VVVEAITEAKVGVQAEVKAVRAATVVVANLTMVVNQTAVAKQTVTTVQITVVDQTEEEVLAERRT